MPYAITQLCCTDASCVAACPVNCIHPTPDEPDFGTTDMLYVDPRTCIDCGACAEACPVDAVLPVETLTGSLAEYPEINAAYFAGTEPAAPPAGSPLFHEWSPVRFDHVLPAGFPDLDVAVVGTGPAGMYTVQDLLLHTTARVTLYDRLDEPGGLVRFGVAPDHADTKRIADRFARYHSHHRLRMRLSTDVGRDVTVADLAARHDAVVYAVGAPTSRDLGVPGEDLPGSYPSTTVVGWYNGRPDLGPDTVDLDTTRAVVVGTGNVALDIARILAADPATLVDTAIDPEVHAHLRTSPLREVVLLGRRGPEHAAWTRGELLGLLRREDLEVVVDDHDPRVGPTLDAAAGEGTPALLRDLPRVRPGAGPAAAGPRRRIVLRFHSSPERLDGGDRVRSVRVTSPGPDGPVDLPAGLVVRAIGHRGRPLPGLPFDDDTGRVPNDHGRVDGRPGTYVVGWIKRGPGGGIGANRRDAAETVAALVADGARGAIGAPAASRGPLRRLLRRS